MIDRIIYPIVLFILLSNTFRAVGQTSMPDYVFEGETKRYYAISDKTTGITYAWWIDGLAQTGFTGNEFILTWDRPGYYLLETQEYSPEGCPGQKLSGFVFVNPKPGILAGIADSMICNGETMDLSVQNPVLPLWGQWMFELKVEAETGIRGSSNGRIYAEPANLNETLFNDDSIPHKVVYRFIPSIISDDGNMVCEGEQVSVTVWVNPEINYIKKISDYNGYNVNCFGNTTGSVSVEPYPGMAPYTFQWTGPERFRSSEKDVSHLVAGSYSLTITDRNECSATEDLILTQPGRLSMTLETSVSRDGNYNINCHNDKNGSVSITPVNNVGPVNYIWADGYTGIARTDLSAGMHKVIISDSNNCLADSTVKLTAPEMIKIKFEVSSASCPDKPDGYVIINVTGGISDSEYYYRWSDNSTERNLYNIPEGLYTVTVTDLNGCSVTDKVNVSLENNTCLIIPEAFSPNNDLINDTWIIENKELYPDIVITIYNRWGQVVWASEKGYPIPWDGRSRGENLPVDSYHYVIDLHNGRKIIMGTITIIR